MNRITDKSFVYTPSFETDLKKKFKMIMQRERKLERERRTGADGSRAGPVSGDSTVVTMVTQPLRIYRS